MPAGTERCDVAVIGGGHNGLVAAALLARAGRSVIVLERADHVGGAAVSARPFRGVDARLSRYAYLVSLLPRALARDLGLTVDLRRRRVASYTPAGARGLLVHAADDAATAASLRAFTGGEREWAAWQRFDAATRRVAAAVFPTLTGPLPSRADLRARVADDAAWEALVERPLGEAVEAAFANDTVRGVVLTDALIGTFASARDPGLAQNRCFLYHVIGNGTGDWDLPVGGMGALTDGLAAAAAAGGATLRTGAEAVALDTDGRAARVRLADGGVVEAAWALCGAAPAVLAGLLGEPPPMPAPEGAQLKLNLLLSRLPRLRDGAVDPRDAFAGTFHVNEGYAGLEAAHAAASRGEIADPVPCETYCHSLSDDSILGPDLRAAGAHTLTVFALHLPARLFRADHDGAKAAAVAATLRSLNAVLAEPIEDCLWRDADGAPCLEARTPLELEAEISLPGGNIFHRDLQWPFAEDEAEIGRWGVETAHPNVLLCGAGARRGGGVSGIPGHNAARAVLASG